MPKDHPFKTLADIYSHKKEGLDFQRIWTDRGTRFALIAPHAGGIEPGTGKLVEAIAGRTFSYYIFEGLQSEGNKELHVPSTLFDDPACLALVQKTEIAIAFHGYRGSDKKVLVGGLNQICVNHLIQQLTNHGFPATRDQTNHGGVNPANICNRCASQQGVQLELSRGLRETFFKTLDRPGREHPTDDFRRFSFSIHKALTNF